MRRLLLLGAVLASLSVVPAPVSAGCVAPYLSLGDDDRPRVAAGARVSVSGDAFVEGCDDTGGGDAFGCTSTKPEPETPYDDVLLLVRQDGRNWELGVADAGSAQDGELGQVTWSVTLPPELQPGRAVLVARISPGYSSDRLEVQVTR